MAVAARRLKFWGWGYEDQQPSHEQVREAAAGIRSHLGLEPLEPERPVELEDLELPAPRLEPPPALAEICSSDPYERALHAVGRGYRDIVRAMRGQIDHPPDVVARPRDEAEVEAVLSWCADAGAAAIPFGGGTSVVGGVEPRVGDGYAGAVTIDLRELDRVLEVDAVSHAARIQAGATGPGLEDQLREHGLTLRHFPQSFEYSTLGGWIVTRAGGHFATRLTHIDDLVESVRAITPSGEWESRRLPGSGAGPSPDRMMLGSEGILGVVTEAWMRVRPRPVWRSSASVGFGSFEAGAAAVRALSQSGLDPANCRLLDPGEAALTGAASGGGALLVLGFESADHPLEPWMDRALELCADHGGSCQDGARHRGPGSDGERSEGEGAWRQAFVSAPYLRDTMILAGVFSETFETAITWDRLESFVAGVRERTEEALREVCGGGTVTCRFTHVYPDGPAPYFTILAPANRGAELEQWEAVKGAASDAVIAAGGTITHHHAVGRDHRPWYDRQRPEAFARALRAAKAELDPGAILNPGVLIDP
ncbi:MAG: alkyldihydroxyacetonephosphate synthase [Thermoleophilaceae bacterium]|jgi:alkyldihydroxyacetonephosphate synthase|nr:alkyldihydroxyacetonephosphate synthase [Thermoleophilaceae bacterium]